ncbi:MAG: cache domain-containing protein, partial [Alphaproteobacteria bacterium]
VFGALILALVNTTMADETRGTAEQAQALVAKAISIYDAKGTVAFADMMPPNEEFRDRDLYIFVIGSDNRTVAHGRDPGRVGNSIAALVDSTGKAFGKEIIEKADEQGVWIDYVFRDPLTEKDVQKSSWIVRHDGYIFGCGIYKP